MYQLHVSAIILAIVGLYSNLQGNYAICVFYLGERDLVYNCWCHGLNLLHNQTQNNYVTVSDINILYSNMVNKRLEFFSKLCR